MSKITKRMGPREKEVSRGFTREKRLSLNKVGEKKKDRRTLNVIYFKKGLILNKRSHEREKSGKGEEPEEQRGMAESIRARVLAVAI